MNNNNKYMNEEELKKARTFVARDMANKRWAKVSKEERHALSKKMLDKRWGKKE